MALTAVYKQAVSLAVRSAVLPNSMNDHWPLPRAAYVHVPFCAKRCGYCNFTVVAGRDDLVEPYLAAVARELERLGGPHPVDTLFVGGGTPTQLSDSAIARLLAIVSRTLPLEPGGELSIEANPADLNADKMRLLADLGVTRLSLGAQSFQADKLNQLDRDHGADEIRHSVECARRFIRSISLDLIFGVPGETLPTWEADIAAAVELAPEHISTYGLTFERGSRFWGRRLHGQLLPVDEELERAMFGAAIDRLIAAGFEHYEISNFARPGYRCRHNETYWAGESYWAVGPGAARYVGGRREINHQSTTTYIRRMLNDESPVAHREQLEPEDRSRELLVFGLRRLEGIDRRAFFERTGYELDQLVGSKLTDHVMAGRLIDDGRCVRLSREGLFVSDAIWPDFLRV